VLFAAAVQTNAAAISVATKMCKARYLG